jgi:small-conductance mechanosensitive channel
VASSPAQLARTTGNVALLLLAAAILGLVVPTSALAALFAVIWPDIDDPDPNPDYGAAAVLVAIAVVATAAALSLGALAIRNLRTLRRETSGASADPGPTADTP